MCVCSGDERVLHSRERKVNAYKKKKSASNKQYMIDNLLVKTYYIQLLFFQKCTFRKCGTSNMPYL